MTSGPNDETPHMLGFQPEGEFWNRVANEYWQQKPLAFTFTEEDTPFGRDAVFAALTADVPHDPLDWIQLATSNRPNNVRDYRMVSFRRYGPAPADGDFSGYFERLRGLSFGFNVHDLGRRNPVLLNTTKEFSQQLSNVPGTPPVRKWELDVFAGSYPVTPLGIHRDNAGVFSFSIFGKRTYLLWPPDYFTPGHPDLIRPDREVIERHAADAIRIDVAPGRGVYWPPHFWHVVLADGNPFAVAQVSAYFEQADLE